MVMPDRNANGSQIRLHTFCQNQLRVLKRLMKASARSANVRLTTIGVDVSTWIKFDCAGALLTNSS